MIKNIMEQLRNKVFNKILFMSSLTIIITMLTLLFTISHYYSEVIVQKEMDSNMRTLERVESYINRKKDFTDNAFKELYTSGDLIFDISYALQHDYDDYLEFRLNKYSDSSSFVASNIDNFFYAYFSQDNHINAISLRSVKGTPEYLYVFNHFRWKNSLLQQDLESEELYTDNILKIQNKKDSKRELRNTVVFKRTLNDPVSLTKLGEISIFYSLEGIEDLISLRNTASEGTYYIVDKDGEVIFQSHKNANQGLIKSLDFRSATQEMQWNNETYHINTLASEENGFLFVGSVPESEIEKLTVIRGSMLLLTCIFALTAILITFFAMKSYSKRIQTIETSIHQVKEGNLSVRIPHDHKYDELSTISQSFNNMLEDLNNYIDEVYIMNIKQREAEMKALQSQINPHFLYNTLEAIRMKAIIEGSKTTSTMIYTLGQLFRYSLDDRQLVTIQSEIEHVKQYINLVQSRYPNRLQLDIDIPKEYLNRSILKFILQPIAENYMIHGFRNDTNENQLTIRLEEENQYLFLSLIDNGMGIPADRLREIQNHLEGEPVDSNSIGLKNIHHRIRLKYGKACGLEINSIEDKGTTVVIKIPANGGDSLV
ncbi:sensor histidine kinase [Rossellomorea sp. BNER]|uniref:sensor histidine kinase n=1 Tax=Rossellomorea sp. BNER TaxID=2962031 RepID=UPI003AF2C1D0|nr:sensor histidine kinase [Rossellomorea sp. BNER]